MMICIPMMGAVLKGTVKDASGNPLYGAIVVIDEHNSNDPKYTVVDDKGRYKISMSAGEHEVAIRMIGFETIREKLNISGTMHKDFIMYEQTAPLATNSNTSGSNNVSNKTQNGNNAQSAVNNKSTSKEVNLTDGLVAYYPFDGNTNDMSGNRNNGKIAEFHRNPMYPFAIPELTFETGRKGKCCHYPNPEPEWGGGYRYKNRFINICVPNSNSLKFNDAVSFSFWFKLDEGVINNIRGRYYGMENGKVVWNSGFVKFFSKASENGQIHAGINIGNRCIEVYNNNESCSASFQLDSKWNHAVMVVTNNYFKIYLNGKEVASKNKNMNFNESNKSDLYIGCIPNLQQRVNKYAYNGCIDEFLIYNRELTFGEVEALFKGEEPNQNYLAYKRAETASLKDAITYLENCTNANYRKDVEDEIVRSKTNNVSDIVYCNENYPKLSDRLEDKMFGLSNSVSDCETYLKYYSTNKRGTAIDDKMFGLINSVSDCEAYMKYYPSSKRMAVVDDKMYQYVNASTDINDCESYFKVFPQGKHKSSVVAQKNEIASYNAAINGGKAECNAYLKKYPKGRFASEIQAKIDYMNRQSTVVENASRTRERETGRSQGEPSVNENNIMDYVKSMKIEEYDGDTYYYVYFNESDGMKGTLRYTSWGDWEYCSQGHYVFSIFNEFISSHPNTKLGALVNLYKRLHDPRHR